MTNKMKIDKTLIINEVDYGFYIKIETPVEEGDCIGDLISIDLELNGLWFDSRLFSVLEQGWRGEDYQEIQKWLKEIFEGIQIESSILGAIRRYFINNGY